MMRPLRSLPVPTCAVSCSVLTIFVSLLTPVSVDAFSGRVLERLNGTTPSAQLGRSVSDAGDVNGDGSADIIVGAFTDNTGGNAAGRAFVFYGGLAAGGLPNLTLTGAAAEDLFGFSVSGAGDVNGDGFDDLIVGAYQNDAGGSNAGRAYVYFGGSTPNAVADLILTGAAADDQFGWSVSGAGDVNGDGYSDVIVGAPQNDAGGVAAGRAYVYYGGPTPDAVADLVLTGVTSGDVFGISVSDPGDMNGDGYADVVVGAYLNDAGGGSAGQAYVFAGGLAPDNVSDLTLTGEAGSDNFGTSVSAAGDMNGDGYDDVIVGAPDNDAGGLDAGRAYVYYGGSGFNVFESPEIVFTGSVGDQLGFSVSGAGDVNGDGNADVIVGAHQAAGYFGRAYVHYGGPTGDAVPDLTMTGEGFGQLFGISVSGGGDFDGDGYADVLVGAAQDDFGGINAGRVRETSWETASPT